MTYKNLQDDVLDRLNFDNSLSSSGPRTRIKRYLNEWYRRLLASPGMSKVRDSATTITTVIGTADYTLSVSSLRDLYDATHDWKLEVRTLGWLRERDPGSDVTGSPVAFVVKSRTASSIVVTLWPTPDAVATIKVDGESVTTDMSADADIPIIPADFHYLLGEGAMFNEYMRLGDTTRAQMAEQIIRIGQRTLRVFLFSTGTSRLVPGRTSRATSGRSRLGSNFPSDF